MNPDFLKTILEYGAFGILTAALCFAVYHLWKRCNILSDQLYECNMNVVKRDEQFLSILDNIDDELKEMRRYGRLERSD